MGKYARRRRMKESYPDSKELFDAWRIRIICIYTRRRAFCTYTKYKSTHFFFYFVVVALWCCLRIHFFSRIHLHLRLPVWASKNGFSVGFLQPFFAAVFHLVFSERIYASERAKSVCVLFLRALLRLLSAFHLFWCLYFTINQHVYIYTYT